MSAQDFASAQILASQLPFADPIRYGMAEAEAFPLRNRRVDQTLQVLNFMKLDDAKIDILAHRLNSNGPDAGPTDLSVDPSVIAFDVPYNVDTNFGEPGQSVRIELKELAGRFDMRDYSKITLANDTDQVRFQIAAKTRAIRAAFGYYFILGDSTGAGQFDGLDRMVVLGLAQNVSASMANQLDDIDDAIGRILVNDRRPSDLVIMTNAIIELRSARRCSCEFSAIHSRISFKYGINNGKMSILDLLIGEKQHSMMPPQIESEPI